MLLVGVQRFYPVQAERGGGGCRPLYPKFSAPPAGPLQAAEATFPIWHRFLPTCWDFESVTQFICVLFVFSQDCSFVSYSHRAKLMCPILILTGLFICVLFSQGKTNVKCVLILIYKNNKYLY